MKKLAMTSALMLSTSLFTLACMTEDEEPELEIAESQVPLTADQLETVVVRFEKGTITLDNKENARLVVNTDPGVGDVYVQASIDAICTDGEHVIAWGQASGGGQPLLDITAVCATNHIVSISDATVLIGP